MLTIAGGILLAILALYVIGAVSVLFEPRGITVEQLQDWAERQGRK